MGLRKFEAVERDLLREIVQDWRIRYFAALERARVDHGMPTVRRDFEGEEILTFEILDC